MIRDFINSLDIEFYENINIKKYNTYRLDVVSKYLVIPDNKEKLRDLLIKLNSDNIKYLVLGNGSNVIFKNDYYDGVIILLSKLNKIKIDGDKVVVGAGYYLPKLAGEVAKIGLSNLEFASGIPGLVGASVAMNAGAYNSSFEKIVDSVMVLDNNFNFITLKSDELDFSYRSSIFKKNKDYVIVEVSLKLEYGDSEELLEKIKTRRLKRLASQPLDMPSAGSVFRNPSNLFAGELIEKCGLKGYSIGGAMVSLKHANFIVNNGNAKGMDIINLIDFIKSKVMKEFGVELILEQIIID